MLISDFILKDYKAQEIARSIGPGTGEVEGALMWFRQLKEGDFTETKEVHPNSHYVADIDEDAELWYCYGAHYYFAIVNE